MTIYAPEQDIVWYKSVKGGGKTLSKHRAIYLEPSGKTRARIKVKTTGEIKTVPAENIMSLSQFKGSHYDLK